MPKAAFNLKDLSSPVAGTKYAAAKQILAISTTNPESLYRHIDFFIELMATSNQILRWTAIQVLGRLAAFDTESKIERLLPSFFSALDGGSMITANNAIMALSDIATAKPDLEPQITDKLLQVERYTYDSVECSNIAIGKVVLGLGQYFPEAKHKDLVLDFVKRQIANTRPATRKKAEAFLKKFA